MKKIELIGFMLMFLAVCGIAIATPKKLVTIKYCLKHFRTFEIVGTTIKGIELDQLADTLKKFKSENPNVEYELLAEVKCMPEMEERIIKEIKNAGIKLTHYWVPVSFENDKPGPYGSGFVDIIGNKTSSP